MSRDCWQCTCWCCLATSSVPGAIESQAKREIGDVFRELIYHSYPSLLAQLVKNPPAMQETWV